MERYFYLQGNELPDLPDIPLLQAAPPRQDNFTDCGVFLLHNAETLLARVELFARRSGVAEVDQAWFPRGQVDKKRAEVAALVRRLWKQQRGRHTLATWPPLTFLSAKPHPPGRRQAGRAAPRADPPRRPGSARGLAALDALPRVPPAASASDSLVADYGEQGRVVKAQVMQQEEVKTIGKSGVKPVEPVRWAEQKVEVKADGRSGAVGGVEAGVERGHLKGIKFPRLGGWADGQEVRRAEEKQEVREFKEKQEVREFKEKRGGSEARASIQGILEELGGSSGRGEERGGGGVQGKEEHQPCI